MDAAENKSERLSSEAATKAARTPINELLSRAKKISPILRSRAEQMEKDRRVPTDIIELIREAELFKLMQPRRFGGFEYGFTEFLDVNFELAQGCGSAAWCASLGMVHQWLVALFNLETQQEVWANKGAIVAGSYIPIGKCAPVSGGYFVTGKWPFTSNCDNADFFLLGTMFPSEGENGSPSPGFALFPRSEISIIDDWFSVGLNGTGSKSVTLSKPTFLPSHRRLLISDALSGAPPGSLVHANPIYTIPFLSVVPVCLAGPSLGIVQGAINEFLDWIGGRTTLGAVAGGGNPMAEFAHVQSRIAEAMAGVDAAKVLLQRDTQDIEGCVARGEPITIDIRMRSRRDHAYAARLAVQSVNVLFEAVGAGGLSLSSGIQRAWRDVNAIGRHASLNWDAVSTMYGQHKFGLKPKGQY